MNEAPEGSPAVPVAQDAATVVVVRDVGSTGLEVFLLRRRGHGFLGGMHLFPGGKVEPADRDPAIHARVEASDLEGAPARLGEAIDVATAVSLHVTAFRETLEECGLLPGVSSSPDRLERARAALPESGLLGALDVLGQPLDLDALVPLSRWVTPTMEVRRFDARFFLARASDHQEGRADGSETDHALWIRPAEALAAHAAGRFALLPPTWMTLDTLARAESVDALLEDVRRTPTPRIQPEPVAGGDFALAFPGDPAHRLGERALPGPTRLRFDDGLWVPAEPA